jgi:fucose permease
MLGVLVASFGPAIPTFRSSYGISIGTAGLIFGAFGGSGLVGTLLTAGLASRLSVRVRLVCAALGMGFGSLTMVVAPSWIWVLAGASLAGCGAGAIAGSYQILFASGFGSRSGTMLALVNGVFGLGAVIGPLLLALLPARDFRLVYLFAGVASLCLLPMVAGARPSVQRAHHASGWVARPLRRRFVIFCTLLFLVYGTEASIGGWEATYLRSRGLQVAIAAGATAVFWTAYTFVRLAGSPLLSRFAPRQIPRIALPLVVASLLLTSAPVTEILMFGGVGFCVALVVPATLAWFQVSVPASEGAATMVVASGTLGSMLLPMLTGQLISVVGGWTMPFACATYGSLAFVAAYWLSRREPRQPKSTPEPIAAVAVF